MPRMSQIVTGTFLLPSGSHNTSTGEMQGTRPILHKPKRQRLLTRRAIALLRRVVVVKVSMVFHADQECDLRQID
ncbi:hypothetical protein CA13_66190 [Planctomycetes bacterium CA13]|uniref:Uncharacterized protein n=1 Tax=Novipirellula herctigrandis TaxID=2527986 RepID=A0A5C5ZDI8_9BACT|nr:hypothetical protein CA13_66190 [Planctomycetes bacterium CA13]